MKIRNLSLTAWIFIAVVAGLFSAYFFPEFSRELKPVRNIFLSAIKCLVGPLIFSSIVVGIGASGGPKVLGRLGFKAIVYFEIATTLALVIGLFFVNVFKPGQGLSLSLSHAQTELPKATISFAGFVEHLVPHSFIEPLLKGDVLQMVILATLLGVSILMAGEKGQPVFRFFQSLLDVCFEMTKIVMKLAPLGVGAALALSISEHGFQVMVPLLRLVGSLYFALFVFFVLVLFPALKWSGVGLKPFLKELRPSLVLAFMTTSSESAYPDALKSLKKMGVQDRISSFVLPLGYSFNLDGSTLYLAMASVFVAQAAGIELSLGTQLAMMATLMLTTKGVAAVPRASLVVLSGTLTAFGLPLEGITLILAVDEFMDMARTSINLLGNCVATMVVSKWEGEKIDPEFES